MGTPSEGLEPLKGSVTLNAPTLQAELTTQPIEGLGSTENNSLEIGTGNKAFLEEGKTLLRLAPEGLLAFAGLKSTQFKMTVSKNEKVATFTIENISKVNKLKIKRLSAQEDPDKKNQWTADAKKAVCEAMEYEEKGKANSTCTFTETYQKAVISALSIALIDQKTISLLRALRAIQYHAHHEQHVLVTRSHPMQWATSLGTPPRL